MEEETQELFLPLSLSQLPNITSELSIQSPESSKAPSMEEEASKAEHQNPETPKEKSKDQPIDEPFTFKTANTFSFQLSPAIKLKQAVEALSDREFNKEGTAMIEVEHDAVELTVRNNKKEVLGYLRLNAWGLNEFDFRKPLRRKMINLHHISQNLVMASDMDTLTVYHVDGSDKLCLNIGTKEIVRCRVQLLDIDEKFEKVPDIDFACECVLLNEYLWRLLGILQANGGEFVSFEISDRLVKFFVGMDVVRYEYETKKGGIRGVEQGQTHHAFFQWQNCEILRKASLLTKGVLVCIVTYPNDSIMWRFNLQHLGDLVFIKKLLMLTPNLGEGNPE